MHRREDDRYRVRYLRAPARRMIGLEHRAGGRQREQGPNHVATLCRHTAGLDAQARHPHRWRWLLVRSRPCASQ